MKLFGITFAEVKNLFFLPLFVLAIIFIIWRYIKTKHAVQKLACFSKINILFKNFSRVRNIIKSLLLSIGLLFLFLGLLRPQWDKKEEVVTQKGRDLFIAIDISRSMLAQDYKPNRLEFAKEKIKKLVSNLKSERVSLIIFSGDTVVQCPLTNDFAAFFMFLDQLDVETISSGTTALDQPIKEVLKMLKENKARKSKLLIIFTDGEDFSSNLAGIKQEAVKEGLKIFTMGVGTTQGVPIPQVNNEGVKQGYMKDKSGNVVISRLNEGILNALAIETGGEYIKLTKSDNDLRKLISVVQSFEKDTFEDKKLSTLQERYNYFLFVSLICLAIEWLL